MTCELQWDITAEAYKGIAQFSYAQEQTTLPSDEHGFYYGVKYGFDGVVTERYYALRPGDYFYNAELEDPDRISAFKSIARRSQSTSDYYISYRSRPFTFLDQHPEINRDQRLLEASTGVGIRYTAESKEYRVYYVYSTDARCQFFRQTSEDAKFIQGSQEMKTLFSNENEKLEAFKTVIGYRFRGFDASQIAELIFVPGLYLYSSFWDDESLNTYLLRWPDYSLPKQIYNI